VGKDILQSIGQLECVDIPKTELNMDVHDKLGKTEDLTTEMERISKTRFLPFLGDESPVAVDEHTGHATYLTGFKFML
jgi:hypothetical protein